MSVRSKGARQTSLTKKLILEAVSEGVSPEAADNLSKLKKDELVAATEERLASKGWLPAILRVSASVEAVEAVATE